MLNVSDGALNITGNLSAARPDFDVPLDNAAIYAPTTNFNSALFDIQLSPVDISSAGIYALVYSPVPLTNYVGTNAPTWSASPHLTVTRVTPSGDGDFCRIGGSYYWCLTVTVA